MKRESIFKSLFALKVTQKLKCNQILRPLVFLSFHSIPNFVVIDRKAEQYIPSLISIDKLLDILFMDTNRSLNFSLVFRPNY